MKTSILRFKRSNDGFADRRSLTGIRARYKLKCSICGLKTVYVSKRKSNLVISSPLRSFGVPIPNITKFLQEVKNKKLINIHQFLIAKDYDGLDFYCPECDKIYCENHYALRPHWERDFYDYTEGKCPNGHKRVVDD